MKFTLLRWLTRESSLWDLNPYEWEQHVGPLINDLARKNNLKLISVAWDEQTLELFFLGVPEAVKHLQAELRKELYSLLKLIHRGRDHRGLSDISSIIEIKSLESENCCLSDLRDLEPRRQINVEYILDPLPMLTLDPSQNSSNSPP